MEGKIYKDRYTIYPNGDLYSTVGKKMKPGKDGRGYHFVLIHHAGNRRPEKVHRIVATCFIPNPDNKPQVNHKDCNKDNNSVENLEWVTQSENMKHAFASGLCKNTVTAARINGAKHGPKTVLKAIEATRKPVINTSTGRVYASVVDAAAAAGYKYDTFRAWLNGVNRNKTSFQYLKSS